MQMFLLFCSLAFDVKQTGTGSTNNLEPADLFTFAVQPVAESPKPKAAA